MWVDKYDLRAASLGINNLSILTRAQATQALLDIDSVLEDIHTFRARVGAQQNRLEYAWRSVNVIADNLEDSRSRIMDSNIAKEVMRQMKIRILKQSSIAMISQASSQHAESVRQLLFR
jgi:flagellin